MEEKSYTKNDLMAALNAIKTPEPYEAVGSKIYSVVSGSPERELNKEPPVVFAILGAEALIDTLDRGLSTAEARGAFVHALGEECKRQNQASGENAPNITVISLNRDSTTPPQNAKA